MLERFKKIHKQHFKNSIEKIENFEEDVEDVEDVVVDDEDLEDVPSLQDKETQNISDDDDSDLDEDDLDDLDDKDEDEEGGEEGEEEGDIESNLVSKNNREKKSKNKNKKTIGLDFIGSYKSVDDLEEYDSSEFLEKFKIDERNDYIGNVHRECWSINNIETNKLSETTKKDNIIVDKLHRTIPFLTKYEKTKIIGLRLKQLNSGAKPYIVVDESIIDNIIIANMELLQKKLPFIIQRPLPNNTFEYWKLQDLEII